MDGSALAGARGERWLPVAWLGSIEDAAGFVEDVGFALSPVWWTAAAILIASVIGLTVYEVLGGTPLQHCHCRGHLVTASREAGALTSARSRTTGGRGG